MSAIVFGGVSPHSLGGLLKGFGIVAVVGEDCPDALFWWDEAYHLMVERPCDRDLDESATRTHIEELLRERVAQWAESVSAAFKPVRASKDRGIERQDSKLKRSVDHDGFDPEVALLARAVGLPIADRDETEPHPLFPAHGQEGSGDYFSQTEKAVKGAKKAGQDLAWSLFADGSPGLSQKLESGYLFFPEPMKRYATGIEKWEREKDAALSPWCFLLAVRGALVFRGSIRRMRWGRRAYPAFPFVFEGSTVELGRGKYFRNLEVHLPTWTSEHPRTLEEFQIQLRQFQARLGASGFAATAAEFRAAVVGRGTGAAFDTFHRFVLEGRRPGQRQPMRQGIPRGRTRVGGVAAGTQDLRLMLAPLAEAGWLDQFTNDRMRAVRARVEEAVHGAVDDPGLDAYRGVLAALWEVNREMLLPGALRREFEDAGRTPRPVPPLPARLWESALNDGLSNSSAYRLGRAIGSMGARTKDGPAIGPILEHMLPVKFDWRRSRWTVPDPLPSRLPRWSGRDPLADFREMFWSRWLDSASIDRLPFRGARQAPLADVVALLRGDVDAREVQELAAMFALLDWTSEHCAVVISSGAVLPIPPCYAALRLWLELGAGPAAGERPSRDGDVARLVSLGSPAQAARASELALSRLRTSGLPWNTEPRPTGKAVARFRGTFSAQEAARVALAIMVPITPEDTFALARRLWVPLDEQETAA